MKKNFTLWALACATLLSVNSVFAADGYPYEDFETVDVYSTTEWIEIDGVADEAVWSSPSVVENKIGKTLRDWGGDPIANTWGFEANYKAVRDANYLYLFIEVKDNTYVPYDKSKMTGETNIDNIELFFFPDPEDRDLTGGTVIDARARGLSQIRVSVGNTENRVTGGGYAMGFAVDNVITGYEYATVKTDEGYNVEVVIPWDVVVSEAFIGNLATGKKILFDINIANCTDYASGRVIIQGWSGDDFHAWKMNARLGEMVFKGDLSGISETELSDVKYIFNNGILELFDTVDNTKISVYDLSGCTVGSYVYNGQNIDLTALNPGVYFVQLENADSFKIMK